MVLLSGYSMLNVAWKGSYCRIHGWNFSYLLGVSALEWSIAGVKDEGFKDEGILHPHHLDYKIMLSISCSSTTLLILLPINSQLWLSDQFSVTLLWAILQKTQILRMAAGTHVAWNYWLPQLNIIRSCEEDLPSSDHLIWEYTSVAGDWSLGCLASRLHHAFCNRPTDTSRQFHWCLWHGASCSYPSASQLK